MDTRVEDSRVNWVPDSWTLLKRVSFKWQTRSYMSVAQTDFKLVYKEFVALK